MDPMLSMLMANMAHVGRSSLVCDPFVGSGQSWIFSLRQSAQQHAYSWHCTV